MLYNNMILQLMIAYHVFTQTSNFIELYRNKIKPTTIFILFFRLCLYIQLIYQSLSSYILADSVYALSIDHLCANHIIMKTNLYKLFFI